MVPTSEKPDIVERLMKISEFTRTNVDLETVLEIGRSAPPLRRVTLVKEKEHRKVARIGVAYDEAFNFYCQDALDTLAAMGAEICYFSPIHDKTIPEGVDGLYMEGDYRDPGQRA